MKFNSLNATIGVAISVILAYLCYTLCGNEAIRMLLTFGSFIAMLLTVVPAVAVRVPEYPRTTVLLKTISITSSVIIIAENFVFALFDFAAPYYIITTAIFLLIYMLIYSSVYKAKQ